MQMTKSHIHTTLLGVLLLATVLRPLAAAGQRSDSLTCRYDHRLTWGQTVAPTLLLAGGATVAFTPSLHDNIDIKLRDWLQLDGHKRYEAENVLQYVPISSVVLLKACGLESRHNWRDMVSLGAGSALFTVLFSNGLLLRCGDAAKGVWRGVSRHRHHGICRGDRRGSAAYVQQPALGQRRAGRCRTGDSEHLADVLAGSLPTVLKAQHTMHPIAHIESCFATKFGIPRQAGIVDTPARIVFEPEYRVPEAVRGLEDFEYIWLIWQFSEAVRQDWSPTVRPPRLGGNRRMGVFATRSPFRPNALGLSSVRLTAIEQHATLGAVLHVTGADLMDGTPIYDIKPYLPYTDSHPDARSGFAPQLTALLAHDPRPQYQHDPGRLYGMEYGGCEIKFRVTGRTAVVERIDPKRHDDGAAQER